MHGAAPAFARRFLDSSLCPDLILATDMLDLSVFLGLTRARTADVPSVLYMHENQLLYPLPADPSTGPMRRQHGERDLHYAFVNYLSMAAADRVVFNSEFHRAALLEAIPRFLRSFPDENDLPGAGPVREKSVVLSPGIEAPSGVAPVEAAGPPLVLWNQRWEYDKRPELFFAALQALAEDGVDFRVALCGENFRREPTEFLQARESLGGRIVQWGHASASRYRDLLTEASVVVSTADHEFFGISVVEAMAHGCAAVLPRRLSYPELIPCELHSVCLYGDDQSLLQLLRRYLDDTHLVRDVGSRLRRAAESHHWTHLGESYDALFTTTVARNLAQNLARDSARDSARNVARTEATGFET